MNEVQLESMRAALERFGLTIDERQYSLERIVRLATLALNGAIGLFSVSSRLGCLHLARVGLDDSYAETLDFPIDGILESGEVEHIANIHQHPLWAEVSQHPALAQVGSYLGYPVLSPDHYPVGVLSLFLPKSSSELTGATNRVMVDSTRLIEDSLLLRSQAIRDPLTQLFNRRYFMELIQSEWRRATRMKVPVSVALVDIDHFKKYNDSVGHKAGDEVIRAVSDTLAQRCRRAGDAVARYGGEEFAIILPHTDRDSALTIINDMRQSLMRRAILHPGLSGHSVVTLSAGIATALTVDELERNPAEYYFELADQALYSAKRGGRNRVHAHGLQS